MDNLDKWLISEMRSELDKIPMEIIEIAKNNDNAHDIVFQSVCRKLCFNANDVHVRELFIKALKDANTVIQHIKELEFFEGKGNF